MDTALNIKGLFSSSGELSDVITRRKVCYDTEPYYLSTKGHGLAQIGFQINLYGTFEDPVHGATPDSPEYGRAVTDIRKIAEALSKACDPEHMCESTIVDAGAITYSQDRDMRPDVTVHIPIFDQQTFGHPVDDRVSATLAAAAGLLESAGVRKRRWK